jgi:hypothetical protein
MGDHGLAQAFPLTLSKTAMGFPIHIAQTLLHMWIRSYNSVVADLVTQKWRKKKKGRKDLGCAIEGRKCG